MPGSPLGRSLPWALPLALCFCGALGLALPSPALAQLAPEIGYLLPAGGTPGQALDLVVGGYDWTPDMQVLVHDPRVKLELLGPPGPVLVPEPPFWFGSKARGYAWPLPREFPARLTLAPDPPPGFVTWQVANANGASPPGKLHVSPFPAVAEQFPRRGVQKLPSLPVAVGGQIRRLEEIDQYEFTASRPGPVTIEVVARRVNSPLHAMLKVQDPAGQSVLDVADTEGRDLAASFMAQPGVNYRLSLHDLDYAGDRSYVYRLLLHEGPLVLAAYPAGGRRGESRPIEFVGWSLATGAAALESVTHNIAFPADPQQASFTARFDTPTGPATFDLVCGAANELVEPTGAADVALAPLPAAVSSWFATPSGQRRHTFTAKANEALRIVAQSRSPHRRLDLELAILGPDGKELQRLDDTPGSVDPELLFTPPAEGTYQLLLTDRSIHGGQRSAGYRLLVEPAQPDFQGSVPSIAAVPLGGQFKLPVKITRTAGQTGPITLALADLPPGVTPQADLVIPADKSELAVELTCAPTAAVDARLVTVSAAGALPAGNVTRVLGKTAVAIVMKPRIKLTPEGLDDVRKVNRGSTFLAPVLIERLEGYAGEITLEMTAKQQRHRQGLASDEFRVPADARRVEYPIFIPEWLETTKTSRMILNGSVQIPDPTGKPRTLLQRQELRIGILPEGALLKLAHLAGETETTPGGSVKVPCTLSRAAGFPEPVTLELETKTLDGEAIPFTAQPLVVPPGETNPLWSVTAQPDAPPGEYTLTLRATGLQQGRWKVVSQTELLVVVRPKP